MFFHASRIIFYVALWIVSVVVFGLACARLHYTEFLPVGDPLNGGKAFFDPIVIELIVTSLLTMLWAPYAVHRIHRRIERGFFSTIAFEVLGLLSLCILWIVGAIISTHFWGHLEWCFHFHACRLLAALVAFVWMSFIFVALTFLITLSFAVMNAAWHQPMHGRMYYRDSRAY